MHCFCCNLGHFIASKFYKGITFGSGSLQVRRKVSKHSQGTVQSCRSRNNGFYISFFINTPFYFLILWLCSRFQIGRRSLEFHPRKIHGEGDQGTWHLVPAHQNPELLKYPQQNHFTNRREIPIFRGNFDISRHQDLPWTLCSSLYLRIPSVSRHQGPMFRLRFWTSFCLLRPPFCARGINAPAVPLNISSHDDCASTPKSES